MRRRFLVTVDADEHWGKGALRTLIKQRFNAAGLRGVKSVTVAYAPDPKGKAKALKTKVAAKVTKVKTAVKAKKVAVKAKVAPKKAKAKARAKKAPFYVYSRFGSRRVV